MSAYVEFDTTAEFTPDVVVAASVEHDVSAVLIGHDALPPAFFDLSTRTAGELTHRLVMYGVQLACVVPGLPAQSERFREFAREANRGDQFRFFESRSAAVAWLATGPQNH